MRTNFHFWDGDGFYEHLLESARGADQGAVGPAGRAAHVVLPNQVRDAKVCIEVAHDLPGSRSTSVVG